MTAIAVSQTPTTATQSRPVVAAGSSVAADLIAMIQARTARIGIIGQGYVGLPLALVFAEAGFPVVGFDVDSRKVEALNRGESYIKHIGAGRVARGREGGRFRAHAPTSTN